MSPIAEPIMCECKRYGPVHAWEPGEWCSPQRVAPAIPLHDRLREFVDAELEGYDRCHVAGELQQLSEELIPGWETRRVVLPGDFDTRGGDASEGSRTDSPGKPLTCVAGPGAGNGSRPTNRKITAEIARQVRTSTETGKELAARFGVSQATISHIRRGHTWRDA